MQFLLIRRRPGRSSGESTPVDAPSTAPSQKGKCFQRHPTKTSKRKLSLAAFWTQFWTLFAPIRGQRWCDGSVYLLVVFSINCLIDFAHFCWAPLPSILVLSCPRCAISHVFNTFQKGDNNYSKLHPKILLKWQTNPLQISAKIIKNNEQDFQSMSTSKIYYPSKAP